MTKPITFDWECPRCEHKTPVQVWPLIPARVSGPPEHCHPAEGGEVEPCECDHCGKPFDLDAVREVASDVAREAAEMAAEARAEARREERL